MHPTPKPLSKLKSHDKGAKRTPNSLSPLELLVLLVNRVVLGWVRLDLDFAALVFLGIHVCRYLLRGLRQWRTRGDRLCATEAPHCNAASSARWRSGAEQLDLRANCLSSSVKNLAVLRSAGIISHAMSAMNTVAIPSRMKIHRQPASFPTPSILMMAVASRPPNAPERDADA